MTATEDVAFMHVTGSPRERGRAQGEALRPLIEMGIERWKTAIATGTNEDPNSYLDRFVEGTDFLPSIRRFTPHLLEEVYGIGEGAGLTFRDAYAYQLMDEEWLFRIRAEARPHHCSLLGMSNGEWGTVLAQNMDLPTYYNGTQTLLRVGDGEVEALVFTAAGLIGTCGLNNAGVGLCVNTLTQLSHDSTGLPVAFVSRRILEHPTREAAVEFIRTIPHASGQNYAIASPEGISDFECSAGGAIPYRPDQRTISHTNHPLVNTDLSPEPEHAGGRTNSESRLDAVDTAMASDGSALTPERAMDILSIRNPPVSVPSTGRSMTLGSLVMELSDPPVLHFAAGPPGEIPYRRYTFAEA